MFCCSSAGGPSPPPPPNCNHRHTFHARTRRTCHHATFARLTLHVTPISLSYFTRHTSHIILHVTCTASFSTRYPPAPYFPLPLSDGVFEQMSNATAVKVCADAAVTVATDDAAAAAAANSPTCCRRGRCSGQKPRQSCSAGACPPATANIATIATTTTIPSHFICRSVQCSAPATLRVLR